MPTFKTANKFIKPKKEDCIKKYPADANLIFIRIEGDSASCEARRQITDMCHQTINIPRNPEKDIK